LRVHCLDSNIITIFLRQSLCLYRCSSSNQLAQPSPAERELVRYSRHERPTDRQPCAHCPPYYTHPLWPTPDRPPRHRRQHHQSPIPRRDTAHPAPLDAI